MERNEAQTFADWLREQLTRRGYDLSARGGGQTRFAEESGIGRATVSRMLGGQGTQHDTRILGQLAAALRVPLGEVLVRAGVATDEELGRIANPDPGPRPITPEQAADELGIQDPQARRLFVSMVETLQRTPPPHEQRNQK
ncbi:helix-turn-helix domain-containing protein [Streptomyces sp. NPDC056373]|uniref:helix-turn-helix domain-containing protein n=1 Tax=Streptomyces sp. NPDC056373 TaxID=3345798 RepID=UPI0035E39B04